MTVKVFLKRTVKYRNKEDLLALLKELRAITTRQPGYVSGETYQRLDRPGENMVISTWQSLGDWEKWYESVERKAIQEKIDSLLGEKTEYLVYEYL